MLLVQQHPLQGIAIQEMQYALVLGPSIGTMQFHIRRTGDLFSIKIFSITFFFVTITQVLVQTYTTRGKQQWCTLQKLRHSEVGRITLGEFTFLIWA